MNVERSHHVEVGVVGIDVPADISLTCRICPDWHVWVPVGEETGPTLADLTDLADEHFDNRRDHP